MVGGEEGKGENGGRRGRRGGEWWEERKERGRMVGGEEGEGEERGEIIKQHKVIKGREIWTQDRWVEGASLRG